MSTNADTQTLGWYFAGDSLVSECGEFTIVTNKLWLDMAADGALYSTVTGQLIAGGMVGELLADADYLISPETA